MFARVITAIFAFTIFANAKEIPSDLVEVKKIIPNVRLDIRYATTNNFTGQQLYPAPYCYLRKSTAKKLARVQKELEQMGLGLKIYDGYRPFRITQKMWDLIHDERYVADPKKGSKHNRGTAVDLTIIDRNGNEIPMPTGYDDFTEKAHSDYKNLPAEQIKNRALLRYLMEKQGFEVLSTEWWHFNDKDWARYEILDIDPTGLK
jgi:D-alanyl-D-alanine dipeptidase